jgi:AcrR family transcriptional regulator
MARTKRATPARDGLLGAAGELFYADGIRATGVDAIAERSGVALMTLYNHFGSKDELVVAYLRARSERFCRWLEDELAGLAGDPEERVLGIFDVVAVWVGRPGFRGCPFVNATIELPDAAHPAHAVVVAHKRTVRELIRRHVEAAGFEHAERLAGYLMLIVEGAQVAALLEPGGAAAARARGIAAALLESQRGPR